MSGSGHMQTNPWGPGLIGCTIALGLYGVSLGQAWFYWRAFPLDPRHLKYLVSFVCVLDTLHTYNMISIYWIYLIKDRHNSSSTSYTPWQMTAAVFLSYFITLVVQLFYGHRVWIISAKNQWLTVTVIASACVSFALGLSCAIFGAIKGIMVLFTTPLYAGAALVSVVCDVLITGSVIFYLRDGRSGLRRTETLIQHIVVVFVNMGFLTCVVSLLIFVLYMTQGGNYYIGAPTAILSKCYVNSLLAVLNARQRIRQKHRASAINTLVIPTIY